MSLVMSDTYVGAWCSDMGVRQNTVCGIAHRPPAWAFLRSATRDFLVVCLRLLEHNLKGGNRAGQLPATLARLDPPATYNILLRLLLLIIIIERVRNTRSHICT